MPSLNATSVRAWLSRCWHRPTRLERGVIRLLATRYGLRNPLQLDAPWYASDEDIDAPHGVLTRSGMLELAYRFLYGSALQGDYLEFGCWTGRTFRMAYHHHQKHFDGRTHFWLFDSFEGLPALGTIDQSPKWKAGDFRMSLDEFVHVAEDAGIPRDRYTLVPGYYEQTLTRARAEEMVSRGVQAGVVFIDCDLYESTRAVLEFLVPLLQSGTVLCFDDLYCFKAHPERGEQRAITEFQARHPQIMLRDYMHFGWSGHSFIVHCKEAPIATAASR